MFAGRPGRVLEAGGRIAEADTLTDAATPGAFAGGTVLNW